MLPRLPREGRCTAAAAVAAEGTGVQPSRAAEGGSDVQRRQRRFMHRDKLLQLVQVFRATQPRGELRCKYGGTGAGRTAATQLLRRPAHSITALEQQRGRLNLLAGLAPLLLLALLLAGWWLAVSSNKSSTSFARRCAVDGPHMLTGMCSSSW
jgi:hypothetical protein